MYQLSADCNGFLGACCNTGSYYHRDGAPRHRRLIERRSTDDMGFGGTEEVDAELTLA